MCASGHFSHTNIENGEKALALQVLIDQINTSREAIGADDRDEVGVYFSAWSTAPRGIDPELPLAMSNAGATRSLFSGFAELGTEYAAAWGAWRCPISPTPAPWA